MNNTSRTDWERVDALTESEIDTSEIPPLTDHFFENARWRDSSLSSSAPVMVTTTVTVDEEVLKWFQSQGEEMQKRMNVALRLYAEAHQHAA